MRDSVGYKGSASPFDELLFEGTTLIGMECKMLNDKAKTKSFAFNKVSKDQIEGLLELDKYSNTIACICVNFRWINRHKGETYIIPIRKFLYYKRLGDKAKKEIGLNSKSIPLDFFRENILQLERYKQGWDLTKIKKVV